MLCQAAALQQQYPCNASHRAFGAPRRTLLSSIRQQFRNEAAATVPPPPGLLPQQLLEAATLISTTSSADVISHHHARRLVLGRQPMLSDLMTAYTGPVETVLWKVGATTAVLLLCSSVCIPGICPARYALAANVPAASTATERTALTTSQSSVRTQRYSPTPVYLNITVTRCLGRLPWTSCSQSAAYGACFGKSISFMMLNCPRYMVQLVPLPCGVAAVRAQAACCCYKTSCKQSRPGCCNNYALAGPRHLQPLSATMTCACQTHHSNALRSRTYVHTLVIRS
jgi:hypothetical protein